MGMGTSSLLKVRGASEVLIDVEWHVRCSRTYTVTIYVNEVSMERLLLWWPLCGCGVVFLLFPCFFGIGGDGC